MEFAKTMRQIIMANRDKQLQAIDRLLTIMDELREKCPWDRKQTFEVYDI